ncbi:MAG: hypothetical protein JWQ66_3731 [Mucilaginibacter sp.]|nr:hypothetical protein [Mucilaginibacter sp.]
MFYCLWGKWVEKCTPIYLAVVDAIAQNFCFYKTKTPFAALYSYKLINFKKMEHPLT